MTIGIIAAMDLELHGLQSAMCNPVEEVISGITFVRGTIYGQNVVAAVSGVGKVFAAMCAQTMILRYAPDAVVNIGVAGTLTKDLDVLDIVVATAVCQHDMDTSALGDPAGQISGINLVQIPTDERLSNELEQSVLRCGCKCVRGVIASGDQFVSRQEQKHRIAADFDAVAVEMEGASIGQVCFVNKVPFAVVRTISDGEGADMDYAVFAASAARNSIQVIGEYLSERSSGVLCPGCTNRNCEGCLCQFCEKQKLLANNQRR